MTGVGRFFEDCSHGNMEHMEPIWDSKSTPEIELGVWSVGEASQVCTCMETCCKESRLDALPATTFGDFVDALGHLWRLELLRYLSYSMSPKPLSSEGAFQDRLSCSVRLSL